MIKKRHLLEAWPIDKSLSERYDTRTVTLQKALQLLFSSFAVPYSVLGRLLAIIDVRLREESRHIGVFLSDISSRGVQEKKMLP